MDNSGFAKEEYKEGPNTDSVTTASGSNETVKTPVARDTTDHRYGWFGWKPDCLQKINKPVWLLVFLCFYSFIQGFIINGLINVVISTLEKRFDLPSQKTGLIASTYDIASATLVVFVSYYGGRGHKARWIGFGCVIFAAGSIVFALPHFTTGLYKGTSDSLVCVSGESSEECVSSSLSNYFYVFILSQVLNGIGVTPLYTIGITLLDESVNVFQSAFYTGIFLAMAVFGPGIGYILGGVFLNIYTDVGLVDIDTINLTPNDPGWVGAWWLGFIIGGVFTFLLAVPLLGFPSELPGTADIRAAKDDQSHQSKSNKKVNGPSFGEKLSDFPRAIKYLLVNPPFVCLALAGCFEGFVLGGIATFGPKVIETQFGQPASTAALLFGACAILCSCFGTLLGGYLVKRWQLKTHAMIKFCCVTSTVSTIGVLVLLIRCSQDELVGVNVGYDGNTTNTLELTNDCNTNCGCTRDEFNPICGDNGMLYVDPCFAGCTNSSDDSQQFSGCSCLSLGSTNTSLTATVGKCESSCNLLPVFIVILAIMTVSHFLAHVPGIEAILRVVPESQRSLAVGVQWIFIRFLGSIPGPIAFGAAFDASCLLWHQDCNGNQGSCFVYSGSGISWKFFLMGASFKILTLISFMVAWWTYKSPPEKKVEVKEETKKGGSD